MSDLPTPINRNEQFLNAIATGNAGGLPTPITREEQYLDYIAKNGGGSGGAGVSSFNGRTGAVVPKAGDYTAEDVGALPADTSIPSKTSDLQNDSGFIASSDLDSTPTQNGTNAVQSGGVYTADKALSDTMAANGAHNLAYSETSGTVIADLKSGVSYIMSFTGGGTVDLIKDTASGTAIETGASSPITITPDADCGLYMVATGTVQNVLVKLATDPSTAYTPYAMTNRELTERVEPLTSRTRYDITSRLGNLSAAISEQNLEKYGYKVGDYFTGASGYTYILADPNPFKGHTTPYCILTNHIGIVVDTHTTSKWHTENAAAVGYNGSTLHDYLKTTVLDNIKADFKALFGGSTGLEHLIAHNKLLTTATANWAWQSDQYISALTCTQVDAGSQWTANGFQEGEASKSLELFRKYKWTEIFGGEYPWLRNISNYDNSSASFACFANDDGTLNGYHSVTTSNFAVGLINFY